MVGRSPPPAAKQAKPTEQGLSGGQVPACNTALKASDKRPNPIIPAPGCPSFLQESSRFDRDFLAAEHARKEELSRHNQVSTTRNALQYVSCFQPQLINELHVHQARWDRARGEAHARELTKQYATEAAEAREQYLHPTGGAISNQSGGSFDILTLQYHNTLGGDQLRQQVCNL